MPHINEKLDFCSEVFVVHDNKVLLRKHDKYKIWLSVGGHIEPGEDPMEAAIREVKEEVGIDVELFQDEKGITPEDEKEVKSENEGWKQLVRPQSVIRHRINETHEHVVFVYFGSSKTDKIILPEAEITEECKWFTKEELDSPAFKIMKEVRSNAKCALEKLSNPKTSACARNT